MSIAVFILVACGQHKEPAADAMSAPIVVMARAKMADSTGGEKSLTELTEPVAANTSAKRYIALRHSLTV